MTPKQRRHFLSLPDYKAQQEYYESLKAGTNIPEGQMATESKSDPKDARQNGINNSNDKKGPTSTPNWQPSANLTYRRFSVYSKHSQTARTMAIRANNPVFTEQPLTRLDRPSRRAPIDPPQVFLGPAVVLETVPEQPILEDLGLDAPFMPSTTTQDDTTVIPSLQGLERAGADANYQPIICRAELSRYCNTPHYAMIDDGADASTAQGGYHLLQIFEHDNYNIKGYHGRSPSHGATRVHAITKTKDHRGNPVLLRLYNSVSIITDEGIPDPAVENLLCPAQLRHYGVYIDSIPHIHGGGQCIVVPSSGEQTEPVIIPLQYICGHCLLEIEEPTSMDLEDNYINIYDLTKNNAWIERPAQVERFDLSKATRGACAAIEEAMDRPPLEEQLHFETIQVNSMEITKDGTLSKEKKQRWKEHLNISDENVLQKTLDNTTQLAVIEYKPELVQLRQHKKRRLYGLSARRISDTVATDTLIPNQGVPPAFDGTKYVQVYVFKKSRYKFYFDMKEKSDFIDSLHALFTNIGIPQAMRSDCAGEATSEEVRKVLNKHKVKSEKSEPHQQQQNFAESAIKDIKYGSYKLMAKTGCDVRAWNLAVHCMIELDNVTARQSLQWATPHEVALNETPDISVYYQFKFWDPVRYTTPGIKFPTDPDLPGRYVGVALDTGDELTYKILVDAERKQSRQPIVIRSA